MLADAPWSFAVIMITMVAVFLTDDVTYDDNITPNTDSGVLKFCSRWN